jgi:hypothetical protein
LPSTPGIRREPLDDDQENVYNRKVIMSTAAAAQFEFSGFPATQVQQEENPITRYLRLTEDHGGLIPQAMIAPALGLSVQRISQLINDDRFEVYQIGATKYVTGHSFERFLREERKTGRPLKRPSVGTLVKAALARKD